MDNNCGFLLIAKILASPNNFRSPSIFYLNFFLNLGCLGQAEACITAILNTIEVTNKSEAVAILNDFLPNFLSYAIVIPQNTLEDYSLTKIIRKVLKSANNLTNNMPAPGDHALLISLYIKAIRVLAVSNQDPYHIGMPCFDIYPNRLLILDQFQSNLIKNFILIFNLCTR